MTANEVPKGLVCIRCRNCDGLYTTNKPPQSGFLGRYYEACPICGYESNNKYNLIPAWKYKFIRWWRAKT